MKTKLPRLSKSELKEWLDQLSESEEGTIILINIFLSFKHKLIEINILQSFFSDCISLRVSDALGSIYHKCLYDNSYSSLTCYTDYPPIDDTLDLITTMTSYYFHRYIFEKSKTTKTVPFVLLTEPKSGDITDVEAYNRDLEKVTSEKWYKIDGKLGRPYLDLGCLWFTDKNNLDKETLLDKRLVTEATKIRDALGLIDKTKEHYLLSIQFSGAVINTFCDSKNARPGFADNGNKRFAVYINNKNAKNIYSKCWGVTVNLYKFAIGQPQTINGIPERICPAIPLSHSKDWMDVKPKGWVDGDRGKEKGIDDDGAFIDRLRGHWTIKNIKKELLTLAN